MPNANDEHRKLCLRNLVNDAVLTDSKTPESGKLSLESPAGKRLRRESVNRVNDPDPFRP